jgi:hypothetical protein
MSDEKKEKRGRRKLFLDSSTRPPIKVGFPAYLLNWSKKFLPLDMVELSFHAQRTFEEAVALNNPKLSQTDPTPRRYCCPPSKLLLIVSSPGVLDPV